MAIVIDMIWFLEENVRILLLRFFIQILLVFKKYEKSESTKRV